MFRALFNRAPAPSVSVVVPLYNHAAFIGDAIGSILAQGEAVKEVIIVDDGSTDESASVAAALAARDGRIHLERQENQGAHAALNRAIGLCGGEFVAILNSDDLYLPGRLTVLAGALIKDRACIAASGIRFIDGTGGAIENPWYDKARGFHRAGAALGVALLNGNFLMTTSNLLFRRAALDSIGGFAALRYAHDLDWLLRALALGHRVAILDQELLRYRIHSGNTISEDHRGVRAEWAIAAAAYLTTLWDRPEAPGINWDEAGAAMAVLRRHELDKAVAPCMAYLRRQGAAPLDRSPLLRDADFQALVREWV